MDEQKCAVCEYPAEGRHFGVEVCKACAAFFRRSLAEDKLYRCRYTNKCRVILEQRNQCRSCRMARCFDVGMTRDDEGAVESLEASPSTSCVASSSSFSCSSFKPTDVLPRLAAAYANFYNSQRSVFKLNNVSSLFTEQDTFQHLTKPTHNKMEKGNASLIATLLTDTFSGFQHFSRTQKHDIFHGFAPKFISLHRCCLTAKYYPNDSKIAFHYGYYADVAEAEVFFGPEPNVEEIKRYIDPYHKQVHRLASKINVIEMSDLELGAIIGLLFYGQLDELGLFTVALEQQQTEIYENLHHLAVSQYGTSRGGVRFATLLSMLLDVDRVASTLNNTILVNAFVLSNGGNDYFMLTTDSISSARDS